MKNLLGRNVIATHEVSRALGFLVSIGYLRACGATPAAVTGSGAYWFTSDLDAIRALIASDLTHQRGRIAR